MIAHAVWVDAAERAALAESGAVVVVNPSSNMNNGVGRTDVAALLEAGRYSDAERVYVGALEQHRHNGWSYFGLERALRAQDKISEADRIKAEFNRVWQRADIIIRSSRF